MIKTESEWVWSQETLSAILAHVVERANTQESDNDYEMGKKDAYFEIVDIINSELTVRDYKLEEFLEMELCDDLKRFIS